jgi:orotate phosphoribosyltransferase-like protein
MKGEDTIARFIHLRAQRWSIAQIATQLNVSKPTLNNWGPPVPLRSVTKLSSLG